MQIRTQGRSKGNITLKRKSRNLSCFITITVQVERKGSPALSEDGYTSSRAPPFSLITHTSTISSRFFLRFGVFVWNFQARDVVWAV
ncbi:hypothetical protein RJT34_13630 [Clitoria ternatea]|uniref:Uncharacterized protein n=1 Tax=Clitoria ternatea TaxID=43366 RepID=A0AAN9PLZ0_CLITE